MVKNITKKYIQKELSEVQDVNGCKALLRAIKTQEDDNNKVIARNARLLEEFKGEEEFTKDLLHSSEIKSNWNLGLAKAREEVYEKMYELL